MTYFREVEQPLLWQVLLPATGRRGNTLSFGTLTMVGRGGCYGVRLLGADRIVAADNRGSQWMTGRR